MDLGKLTVAERPRLVAFFRRQVDGQRAEDLAHTTICSFLKTRGEDRGGNPFVNARAVLWTIARRTLSRVWHAAPLAGDEIDHENPPSSATTTPHPENDMLAATLVSVLEADSKCEYLLLDADGWSREELCRRRGCNSGALRTHLTECRNHFRTKHGQALSELLAA